MEQRSKRGGARPGPHPGRPPTSATIREGDGLMITEVCADGTADVGRGWAVIRKVGRSRIIAIAQDDGSEIRILVVK